MPSTLVIMSRSTRHLTAATRRIIERICEDHGLMLVTDLNTGAGYRAVAEIPDRHSQGSPQDDARLGVVRAALVAADIVPGNLRDDQLVQFRGRCRADYLRAMGTDPITGASRGHS